MKLNTERWNATATIDYEKAIVEHVYVALVLGVGVDTIDGTSFIRLSFAATYAI